MRQERLTSPACALLLLAVLLAGCATAPGLGPATDPGAGAGSGGPGGEGPESVEAQRERYRAAVETFLDPGRPTAERVAAADDLPYPDDDTMAALLAIGSDPTEDDEIRWQALSHHPFTREYIEAVLAILSDPAEGGGEELHARLVADLGRRAFKVPEDLELRIVETLRELLDDPRDRVRLAAYRALVTSHDTVAVSRLSDGLASEAGPPIPLDEAIRLLDIDGSVNHVAVIRPFLGHPEAGVRAEAARSLAVDPDSRPAIVEMVTDREAPEVVRLRAIRALAREDDGFPKYATALVADREESLEVRRAAMKAMVGRMNYFRVPVQEQIVFAEVVARIARSGPRTGQPALLAADARKLMVYMKKAFPPIAEHFGDG